MRIYFDDSLKAVTPAKAGVQSLPRTRSGGFPGLVDSRLRGNDDFGHLKHEK